MSLSRVDSCKSCQECHFRRSYVGCAQGKKRRENAKGWRNHTIASSILQHISIAAKLFLERPIHGRPSGSFSKFKRICPIKNKVKNAGATLDPSSTTFDDTYFKLILQGKTLFSSYQALLTNSKTKGLVYKFASSKQSFNEAFVNSMIKISSLNGGQEIRKDYMSDSGIGYGQGRISTLELPFRRVHLEASEHYILRREVGIELKAFGEWPLNRPIRREVEPENWISFAMKLKSKYCSESNILRCEVEIGSGTGKLFVDSQPPLRCEHDILRRGVEIGSGIGKLFVDNQPSLRFSRPFAVKLSLCCLGSNILRCEVEISPETRKLLLTTSRPFVVKLNLTLAKT
ncbi:hypothetical protein F3Y22_tig00117012pilonHSYRG00026 [Hibiscus syriacus]|uniref:peroxidase n=1 Tax=Hibiscus syriacus TaxID=106335 RepID=A0A6A2XPY7_HIBSY|nr:hypothetical protein F3Y22_tig00117012pilonHSYRG00026 [Hibiscus syriacus]